MRTHLPATLVRAFEQKRLEYTTADRVYCHAPRCSAFLGAATVTPIPFRCSSGSCGATTCGHCKHPAHAGRPCPSSDEGLLAYAQARGWQRCPACRHVVERAEGCYHMTCICKAEFCYLCATKWKTCDCPHFEIPPELIRL